MSDKPTIPTKDDGSPDWAYIQLSASGLGPPDPVIEFAKAFYIAALERCAEWHEEQSAEFTRKYGVASIGNGYHDKSAATIRQWIEKEK